MSRKYWLALILVVAAGGLAQTEMPEPKVLLESWSEWKGTYGFYALILGALIYGSLLAIPFFPAFEVGLCLMGLFGRDGITMVYIATIAGLCGSFLIGRTALGRSVVRLDLQSSLERAQVGVAAPSGKLRIVRELKARAARSPAVLLAILLNMPFSSVWGGGGAIALAYGAHGPLSFGRFAAAVAAATIPLPLFFYLGIVRIEGYIAQ
jgi:hypothetical protein